MKTQRRMASRIRLRRFMSAVEPMFTNMNPAERSAALELLLGHDRSLRMFEGAGAARPEAGAAGQAAPVGAASPY